MSLVYRAEHSTLGRKVAIKFLAPELADDEAYRGRFLRESRLAAALHHPNIVPIHDAGEVDGIPYITMHFVEGIDLAALLLREAPLATERILAIMFQVAGALDDAHDQGLVHRDVKPANIMIASGEGVEAPGHVYLTDFGLAKQVAGVGAPLTKQGLFMGTLDYIAPEQIQGQEVDRRTDVYSLGCVVYECLTGVTPYPRQTEVAMLYAHMQEPPPAVGERRPDLPARVDAVLARSLAKRADDRYPTCRQFLEDLRAAVDVVPSAGPVELTPKASEPVASEPVASVASAVPPLAEVVSLDHRGSRFGLGRTSTAYAVWSLEAGGRPVRLFPLTEEAWPEAWRAFHELEAELTLTGVVLLDYRGHRYGLGRTEHEYAIWDLTAGGIPVETWPIRPEAWREAWARYQELEAAAVPASSAPPEAAGATPSSGSPALAGAVTVDYAGRGFGLGRTADAYAIWDLGAGGSPIRTFPLHPSSWPEAWAMFQELESSGEPRS